MNRKYQHPWFHFILLQIFVFVLPFNPGFCSVIIGLLAINWILGLLRKQFLLSTHNFLPYLGLVLFYAWHVIALFWSKDIRSGQFEITTKLSFILIPLLFSAFQLKSNELTKVYQSFVCGASIACIYLFGRALFNYIKMKAEIANGAYLHDFGNNLFFKDRISPFVHPSYLAMYLTFALWLIYMNWNTQFLPRKARNSITLLMLVFIVLLNSKMGILSIVGMGLYNCYILFFVKKNIWTAVSTFSIFIMLSFGILFLIPQVKDRLNTAFQSVSGHQENTPKIGSTSERLILWKGAYIAIKDNVMLGSGTGSANEYLYQYCQRVAPDFKNEHKLNAHNQFLQTFLCTGIIGIILLLWIIIMPLQKAIGKGDLIYLGFYFLTIGNLMVESMFETQAGIFFFTIFNGIGIIKKSDK